MFGRWVLEQGSFYAGRRLRQTSGGQSNTFYRHTRGIRSLHEQIKVEVLWNVIYVNMIPEIEITNTPVLTQKTKRLCAI